MVIEQVLTPKVDFSKYMGQWVVICENKLVGHDKNLNKLQNKIKECKRMPTVAKIPRKDTLIF